MTEFISSLVQQNDNGTITTTSLRIAEIFEKRHSDILRSIKELIQQLPQDFNERNFASVEYKDTKGELRPMYTLTRDAFSLLVMGFTGEKALNWKLRYIEAFNAMEQALLDKQLDELKAISDKAYDEGVKVGQNALSLETENMVYKQARERLMRDIDKIEDRAFDEGIKYQKRRDGLASLMKAIDYLSRGVNLKDTAAMLECAPDTIRRRLKRLGLWEQVKKDNMRFSKNIINQGSLLG